MIRRDVVSRSVPRASDRKGAAAVEFAVVLTFALVPMFIGLLQLGRAVQVQQIVANAARDGARLASQGKTVNQTGATTNILSNPSGTLPNVKSAVYQSLIGAGLTQLQMSDVTVQFAFVAGAGTQPFEGKKSERFTVSVSIPLAKVAWISFEPVADYAASSVAASKPEMITYKADWQMLVDKPFQAPGAIPVW